MTRQTLHRFALVTVALLLSVPGWAAPTGKTSTWEIDAAHSSAQFSVRHLMVSNVRGEFGRLSGTIVYDERDPRNSRVEATIDVSSIYTHENKRDEHLKSPDFFDVAKYPTIRFNSKKVEPAGKGKLTVTGDLTIHGVTRQVKLAVEGLAAPSKDPWGNVRSGASATTRINRSDFGIGWNKALETGGVVISDEVAITIELGLQMRQPAPEPDPEPAPAK